MDSSPSPDPQARLLAAWRVAPVHDPRFRAHVWQRIEAGAVSQPWMAYARRHAAAVAGAMAVAMAVGAVTGQQWARARVAAESARLASSYVEGLDARMGPMR